MLPHGIWYGVYGGLIVIGFVVTLVAAPLNEPARIPVFSLGSVALSAGLLAAAGSVLQYIYLPS